MKEQMFLVWLFILFTSPLFGATGSNSNMDSPMEVSHWDFDEKVNPVPLPATLPAALPIVIQDFSRILGEHSGSDTFRKHKTSIYTSTALPGSYHHHLFGFAQKTTLSKTKKSLFILFQNLRI